MKHERATEEMRHQAALYVIGLLTQHEAHCFELHLEDCPICRAELSKLLLTSSQIGLAVKEEEPPQGLRERLAAHIDLSRRDQPLSDLPEKHEPAYIPSSDEPVKTQKPGIKTEPAKKIFSIPVAAPMPYPPRSRKAVFFIHAFIYAILAALGAYAFYLWQNVEKEIFELHSRIAVAEANRVDLTRQLESQREDMEKLERFQEMFHNPSVRVARLKGRPSSPNQTGAVMWNTLTGDITVIGTFDPVPEGMVYQFWFSASSERIYVGRLTSDRNGRILTTVKLNQYSLTASSGITAIMTLESENDLSSRADPATSWVASGKIE